MLRLPRYYVYLLLSRDGKTYIGMTSNIRRRFKQHNAQSNQGWTGGKGPWHLLAVRMYLDKHSAQMVEKQLKKWHRGRGNWNLDGWIRRERPRLRRLCERYGIQHRLA